MARTDLESLVVALDADVNKLSRRLAQAGVMLDTFDRDVDAKTKRTAKKIADNLAGANDNRGLRPDQWKNLGYQINDVFTSLGSGSGVLQVLSQQGGQIYQVLQDAPGGVGGAMRSIAERMAALATPARLAAGGVLGIGAAAAFLGLKWSDAQERIELGLSGIGKASGATIDDINRVAEAASRSGRISTGAAREIAAALAQTGKIGPDAMSGVLGLAPGYAKLFGKDAVETGQDLARIFADPAKGADELDARLAALDDRTRQYIRTLAAQGDRQGAIKTLVQAVQPELDKVAAKTTIWARAFNAVKDAADLAGQKVVAAVSQGTPQQQAAAATADRTEYQRQIENDRRLALSNPISTAAPALREQEKALGDLIAKEEDLNEVRRRVSQADYAELRRKEANELSKQAGEVVRAYDEAGQEIKAVEAQLANLEKALGRPDAAGSIDGGAEKAAETLEAVRGKLALLKKDYAEGGVAAAAALRQADFAAKIAGLSSYERGLREIGFRYDELTRKAKEAGQTDELPSIEKQRQAALTAYGKTTAEQARGQAVLPSDFAASVIAAESSGNDRARNPNSSATGAGQFIESTWLALFKRVYPEMAAGMSNAAIAGLRTDREYSVRLIEEYAKENAIALQQAGFTATSRNLQLAHFLGAGGAVSMLRADPSANAAGILPAAAAANGAVFKNGAASVQDILDYAEKRAQGGGASGRRQRDQVIAEQATAQAYDQTTEAATRLKSIQEQLDAEREKGSAISERFKTADELIKAKSDDLTPALRAQREEILALADARSRAAATGLSTRFETDLRNAYGALGRTGDEQSIYGQVKGYGYDPASDEGQRATEQLAKLQTLTQARDATGSFLKGLASDLANGTKFGKALENQLKRILSMITDKALDKLTSGLFGGLFGGGSGGGGLLSSLFGGGGDIGTANTVWVAGGGHVRGGGSGTSDSIPARLSDGEFVVNAAATRRYLPMLHAINNGMRVRRYATGGLVPSIPMANPAGMAGGVTAVTHAPTYHVTPAGGVTPEELMRVVDRNNRQFAADLPAHLARALKRTG